jgi:hypothetical protein
MSEEQESIEQIIAQAIGEASMCWSETPKGAFDSTLAKEICDRVVSKVKRRHHLETLIRGHMEAMRPLLDEWSGKL